LLPPALLAAFVAGNNRQLLLGLLLPVLLPVLLLQLTSSSLYMPNRMEATSRVVTSFWRGFVAAMSASLRERHCNCGLWQHAHAALPQTVHYSKHRQPT
jgi:hypothetical protein